LAQRRVSLMQISELLAQIIRTVIEKPRATVFVWSIPFAMPLFDFDSADRRNPKTQVHVGQLPAYIDPKQPPTKKTPWRTINEVPFLQSVNLVLPQELYDVIWDKIEDESKKAGYAKVIMKLQDVLDGAFFTEYIKKGET
jgi:ribonuclease P/MRP protein subunit RPP40